MRWNIMKV